MKKVVSHLVVILKLGLLLIFLYNIGIFSIKMPDEPPSPPLKTDEERKADLAFLKDKLEKAEALGTNYGPKRYFSDLADIRLKEKNNDFDRCVVLSTNNYKTQLNSIMNKNMTNCLRNEGQAKYQALLQELDIARDSFMFKAEPEMYFIKKENEVKRAQAGYNHKIFLSVINFLFNFYIKNFIFGLSLLLLWHWEQSHNIKIKNPFNFMLCALFYPVVIIAVWRRRLKIGSKELAMKIELKRRKADIFSVFSENEIADIKRFAKSNFKVKDYHLYLDNHGLKRLHALTPALILSILVISTSANYQQSPHSLENKDYCYETLAPPGLNYSTNTEKSAVNDIQIVCESANLEPLIIVFKETMEKVLMPPAKKKRQGYFKPPNPVPIFA